MLSKTGGEREHVATQNKLGMMVAASYIIKKNDFISHSLITIGKIHMKNVPLIDNTNSTTGNVIQTSNMLCIIT